MPFVKHIYRLPLALLLLGLFVFANQRGAALPHAVDFTQCAPEQHAGIGDSVDESQYPISLFASIKRPAAPIIGSGNGSGPGTAVLGVGTMPHTSFPIASCSKLDVKKRLTALQEHYTFQQRLALYPKHWFW